MARREFTEEEMNQLKLDYYLNNEGSIFAEKADEIIDQCIMIPISSYEKGAAKITELTKELDITIREYEQEVRDNGMWKVGFADVGLNNYTMLVKTYKRASNMLKSKAMIMSVLIHD